jgi:glycosyltransferase involved in cell wall biosynthesis
MKNIREKLRIAWLIPSLERRNFWHPVLSEFTKIFQKTIVYTGYFPGYAPGFENAFNVKKIGEMRSIGMSKGEEDGDKYSKGTGYGRILMLLSLRIVPNLLNFKPDVIFSRAFSLWTLLALILRPMCRWRVIIEYEGDSPVYHVRSPYRTFFRILMAKHADAFITNDSAGRDYLVNCLKIKEDKVFVRPYLVPDAGTMFKREIGDVEGISELRSPVFLYVGQLIPRKGLRYLLEACVMLKEKGKDKYTLMVVGDGPQCSELKDFCREKSLENNMKWLGWQEYAKLGNFFDKADIFVFPTLEDVWGMAVLEAMEFGMPVLCSKWAGAADMVKDGENGYIFDPYDVNGLCSAMSRFIDNPDLVASMGQKSKQLIAPHNPEAVARFLGEVVDFALSA